MDGVERFLKILKNEINKIDQLDKLENYHLH